VQARPVSASSSVAAVNRSGLSVDNKGMDPRNGFASFEGQPS
jgi:hypothetical protein